ncbi:MAG: hypothetical protein AB1757_29825 [Acidobacteriota bacterium]
MDSYLVAQGGFYTENTVDYPKPNETPHKAFSLPLKEGACQKFFDGAFTRVMNWLNGKKVTYNPLLGPNSNSFAYTLLHFTGISSEISPKDIRGLLGDNGDLPGWGIDLYTLYR